MNIRRGARSLRSVSLPPAFALAFMLGCSAQVAIGHGPGGSGGAGGSNSTNIGGTAGVENIGGTAGVENVGGLGGAAPDGGGAGLAQAGAGGSPCSGSLELVNQALGVACPSSLCGATAWAAVSCSTELHATKASELGCGQLRAITLDLATGVSKTCIYAATKLLGGDLGTVASYADGPLVGVVATDTGSHFCEDTSATISAGQQLPVECGNFLPSSLCEQTLSSEAGGAPGTGSAEQPVRACFNAFTGACGPCCAATTPDCSDKPDGYPGYSCTPADRTTAGNMPASYCSCACRAGKWQCGC